MIRNSDRAAITIESADGAHIREVLISGIRVLDCNSLLYIVLGDRDRYAHGIGSIEDVEIRDVTSLNYSRDEGVGSCIQGMPERAVRGIRLVNVRSIVRGGGSAA